MELLSILYVSSNISSNIKLFVLTRKVFLEKLKNKKEEIRFSSPSATLFSETLMNVGNVVCLIPPIGDKASFL